MPNLSNTVTFLFAGDGSLSSDGLSAFLQTKSNFRLLSECSNGANTIADIRAHEPEIAVMDAQLPDLSAQQIIEAVRVFNRETKIIVLGASADRNVADELLAAGADAYVVRSGPSRHLNDAIRYVRDGGKYLAPELTKDLPVSKMGPSTEQHSEAYSSLHAAVEAQAITVQRLEHAMDRAQYAIELLQQKVEQLIGAPIMPQPPAPTDPKPGEPQRKMTSARTSMTTVAAALLVAVLGFQLAGILRHGPSGEASTTPPSVSVQRKQARSLTGWEFENVENARKLLKDQQYEAAEKVARTVLKQNPANAAATRILASALFHQDRVSESADIVRTLAVPGMRASREP